MGTVEDIVAATKNLSEDPESVMGSSGSKQEENWAKASDVRKDDVGSADGSVACERVVGTETVVEATLDEDKGKVGVESLIRPFNSSCGVGLNGNGSWDKLTESGRRNEIGEDSLTNNGEGRSTGYKQLNGGERVGLYMDVDGNGEEGIGERLKDQENVFHVGDFVWGKIRSHPWWPGQVYDPKDASEFAMKHKLEGRLLVAFFGDCSCSWCMPSQLIPFVENFSAMSMDSSSKSFLNSVQRAVDEVARLVELEMTCNCNSEKKASLAQLEVTNAGLKAGVVMPEVDVRRLSIHEYKPAEVLEKVMQLAKAVSVDNALDLAILTSWLSAFYCFKGGYLLPVYHGPLHIEGMEDKNKNVNEVADDFSIPIEVPILGPQDDYWLSSPTVGSVNSQGPSENKISHKRKQRSVAEIMGESKNIKPGNQNKVPVKEGTDLEKSTSSRKNKKIYDVKLEGAGSASKGKIGGKRKGVVLESTKIINSNDSNAETGGFADADGVNGGSLLGKLNEIEVADAENTSDGVKEESEKVSTPRERKKSKYLSPPYTNLARRMVNSSSMLESEVEHDRTTNIDPVEEHKDDAVGDDIASHPISKTVDNPSQEKLPKGILEKLDISEDTSLHTVKSDQKLSFSVSDVEAPLDELLSDIHFASVDPFYLSKKGSFDFVWAFLSALRSSTYTRGQDYKIFRKCKVDGSRKSLHSLLGNEHSGKKGKSSDQSTAKASKRVRKSVTSESKEPAETSVARSAVEKDKSSKQGSSKALKSERKSDTSKSRKTAEASIARSTTEMVEGKTLPCLILEFAPGFPLPSKKDIVMLFGKFGSLSEKETNVDTNSHSIRIVYMMDSDAEAAFKSSLRESPFGSKNVNYRLNHSPTGSKPRRSHTKVSSPPKRAPEKRAAYHAADDLVSDMNVIRQKLEITAAIMENYHSKFSPQGKSSLKDEMKHLMEEIEAVSEKVRIMAEKTSS